MTALRRLALILAWLIAAEPAGAQAPLRVCADPNNLPFSNRAGEGFENRIAELLAAELGRPLVYAWWPQRRGFIRNTLKAGLCDLIIGVPANLEMVARTKPYYRSSYVFVTRADRALVIHALDDARLKSLRIGVHLIGDDGANAPPAHALAEQGLGRNVVGFSIYGDYSRANPPARLIEAVAQGDIDVAAAWGPLAGYCAQSSAVPLQLTVISGTERFAPLAFAFDIAMGLRRGDKSLLGQVDGVLSRRSRDIEKILASYGVPFEKPAPTGEAARQPDVD